MPHTLSVSCALLVQMMTGMCLVLSSRASMRVAWKPFWPGMTTSISTRSGRCCLTLASASSALSAVETLYPFFTSSSLRNWRSVAESSTMRMFLIGMTDGLSMGSGGKRSRLDVLVDRLDQPFLSKRLGQVAIGSGEPAARAIEHAVLARQHDHGRGRSEEHTSELQSRFDLVCRLLLEKKNTHNRMYLRS